ncbi:nitrate reductase molybdenum cofactor assembly chaperone [Alicyclobacillus sp.]|uniref:nitrate reductase molybdenum cofactor assembly chaperone n=1 Tax=Alicyclobacillus sp. TaxID=61169 RepID=UPI0025BD6939|nr:nitrate reductase molybdenum cofactor assembly chaperone [Alicyclobacillus sp.]MCL6517048.1 nitrate reductase molybdenum cofactor assembly chaperone [Alicyclobacillus sp.]
MGVIHAAAGLDRQTRFKLVSVLLDYPDEGVVQRLLEARRIAEEAGDQEMARVVAALAAIPPSALARRYVETFDMQEQTALYLTAHELGDSRERGGALLRLHAMLRAAGLEPEAGELPDYLPLLFEFLAEKPNGMPTEDLEKRLCVVTAAIAGRLEPDHPYRPLFDLAVKLFDPVPSDATRLAPVKDPDADSDALPYPLVYD